MKEKAQLAKYQTSLAEYRKYVQDHLKFRLFSILIVNGVMSALPSIPVPSITQSTRSGKSIRKR